MRFVKIVISEHVAIVHLCRGKVNALNDNVVEELAEVFESFKKDPGVQAIVLTGSGAFFSFGFDIPQFLSYSKNKFTRYLKQFTSLYTEIFGFPKPVVAALNGHTVAGGCMIAIACDVRIMADGKAKISLNEIGFGSTVLAGSVEMLRFCVGEKSTQEILYSGEMFGAHEATAIGLVDRVSPIESLLLDAFVTAKLLSKKSQPAFASIKELIRGPVLSRMKMREMASIAAFINTWYSPGTWDNLKKIKISS